LTAKKYSEAEHVVLSRLEDLDAEFEELKKSL
jgi:hypothetical protein